MNRLRQLVWLYLVLLLFEGALRKWVVPALDAPLLIVRDPVVLLIYYFALQNRLRFQNMFFVPNIVLAVLTTFFSVAMGQGNLIIYIFGLRTDFLQIPLIFLIPQILDRDDVLRMGKFLLYAALPIAALVLIQFKSPPDAFLNKGAFGTHYGTVRPSGPFSFITGIISFFSLVSAFLFYGYIHTREFKFWLLAVTTLSTLAASAVSGSRSCLLAIGIVGIIAIICVMVRGEGGLGMVVGGVLVFVALAGLSFVPVFQAGAEQLFLRFHDAAVVESGDNGDGSGMVGRFASTFTDPISDLGEIPTFGLGLGMGTNAAAGLLHGDREFIGPENEWGRLIYECGPVLGIFLCIFRVGLTVYVGLAAFRALIVGNVLPSLIYGAGALLLLNGQWGVPTTLGFSIFEAGLILAACRYPDYDEEDEEDEDDMEEGVHDEADEMDRSLSP